VNDRSKRSPFRVNVGSRIYAAMIKKQLNHPELGRLVGRGPKVVYAWTEGWIMPRLDVFPKLCEVLDVTCDHLLGVEK
jgi:hypothetical protein